MLLSCLKHSGKWEKIKFIWVGADPIIANPGYYEHSLLVPFSPKPSLTVVSYLFFKTILEKCITIINSNYVIITNNCNIKPIF